MLRYDLERGRALVYSVLKVNNCALTIGQSIGGGFVKITFPRFATDVYGSSCSLITLKSQAIQTSLSYISTIYS